MNKGQPLLEKLEELFGDEPFNPVEEELFKWFLFAYTGKGCGIKDLDNLKFALFKDKFVILIDAIYQWQQERMELEKSQEIIAISKIDMRSYKKA